MNIGESLSSTKIRSLESNTELLACLASGLGLAQVSQRNVPILKNCEHWTASLENYNNKIILMINFGFQNHTTISVELGVSSELEVLKLKTCSLYKKRTTYKKV